MTDVESENKHIAFDIGSDLFRSSDFFQPEKLTHVTLNICEVALWCLAPTQHFVFTSTSSKLPWLFVFIGCA